MATLTLNEARKGPAMGSEPDESFEASFQRLFAISYRVAFRILGSREEANDVAAESVAKAWLRWPSIQEHAHAWTSRVAANSALSLVRRRKLFEKIRVVRHRVIANSDIRQDLISALQHLPRRQREVVVLRYIADLSQEEVALTLGCSVGTVKQHAFRGLEVLRNHANLKEED